MANTTFLAAPSNSTDALFRDWGSKISTALSAIGLVRTADTGQIDWATVLTPSATNQSRGYEIYRFNDALQGTYPIFVKVEYGSATNILWPCTWWTVGSATDGAGTLSNLLHTRTVQYPQGAVTLLYKGHASMLANGSGFAITFWTGGGSSYVRHVIVERSCDSSGVPNGIAVLTHMRTSSYSVTVASAANYATKVISSLGNFMVTAQMNPLLDTRPGVAPIAPIYPILAILPGYKWQLRSGVAANTTDIGAIDTLFEVPGPGYGRFINTGSATFDANAQNNTSATLAIAWP